MPITVVIPACNLWEYTRACMESLARCVRGASFTVVVVDNGSTDETPSACAPLGAELFPGRFEYRRQEQNLGFARGCNAGAAGVTTPYLLFLNNDTTATPGWMETLLQYMEREPHVAAASPLLLYPWLHRVQHAGVGFDTNMHPLHLFHYFPGRHPALSTVRNLQALSAAALIVRRQAFEQAGGFCEEYRNGSEDIDLCCTLRRKGGRLGLETRAVLHHATSKTPGRYEHCEHNAKVLNRRVRGCFFPDLQRHAARAGYELGLTSWLEPHLALPLESEEELDAGLASMDASDLARQLDREPLWDAGYACICRQLQPAPAQALPWAEARAQLCPSVEAFTTARSLAKLCGDTATAERWEGRLQGVARALAEPQALRQVAASSLDWCRAEGLEQPAALYAAWLHG